MHFLKILKIKFVPLW